MWYISIVGRHKPTKGHLKIHYYISSTFMQIDLLCACTFRHEKWNWTHFFGQISLPSSLHKWPIFSFLEFCFSYILQINMSKFVFSTHNFLNIELRVEKQLYIQEFSYFHKKKNPLKIGDTITIKKSKFFCFVLDIGFIFRKL